MMDSWIKNFSIIIADYCRGGRAIAKISANYGGAAAGQRRGFIPNEASRKDFVGSSCIRWPSKIFPIYKTSQVNYHATKAYQISTTKLRYIEILIPVGYIPSHPLVVSFQWTRQPPNPPTNQTAVFTSFATPGVSTLKTSCSLLFRRRYPNSTTSSKTTACSASNQGSSERPTAWAGTSESSQ